MSAHIHAALMAEYAKDALETETPWERCAVEADLRGFGSDAATAIRNLGDE